MNLRLDVRRVVEQNVEHVMAFVLVCSDDVGIDRDVVGDQSVGNDSFLKTSLLARRRAASAGKTGRGSSDIRRGLGDQDPSNEDWQQA